MQHLRELRQSKGLLLFSLGVSVEDGTLVTDRHANNLHCPQTLIENGPRDEELRRLICALCWAITS